jgi:hypothetical protein
LEAELWERDEILSIIKYEKYKRNKAALSLLWDLDARNHPLISQVLFVCKTCGEENADRNASFNIAYRALGYISKVGVTVNIP